MRTALLLLMGNSLALQPDSARSIIPCMRIAIGSDHAGYRLKKEIARHLADERVAFEDFGTKDSEPVDYPDIGVKVAEVVAKGDFDRGILVCGSGIGMSITANKVPGIRAALCGDTYCARLSRLHNDANILVLGERTIGIGPALDVVDTWLSTDFPNEERHARRIRKMHEIEEKYNGGGR